MIKLVIRSVNSEVFHVWIKQDLLPKVPEQAVIVMYNASFHNRIDAREAIEARGCTLESLHPYSPDLNPIEHKLAEVKSS